MIELRVLNSAGLSNASGDEVHSVLAQPKRFALLVYLALAAPGRLHRRDSLLAMFWSESDEERARSALRTSLHFLRRSLGDEVIDSRGADEVGLARGVVGCDALVFQDALNAERWEDALELYRGPMLPGFGLDDAPAWDEWLDAERARLARGYLHALQCLTERREAAGDREGALEGWRRLAAEEPFHGEYAGRLMRALAATGDRAGALEHARRFQARLGEEFGAEPDPAVAALAEELRLIPAPAYTASRANGNGATPRHNGEASPSVGSADPHTNGAAPEIMAAPVPEPEISDALDVLPVPRTPLIGRERELASVVGMLLRDDVRLLTLLGAGGIGKTRLVLAAAREVRGHFPDGTFFVDLTPLSDPALVPAAIADALGLQESGSVPLLEVICDHLRTRSVLLVLDNLEHVLAAAPTIKPLFDAAPRLTVLATSRAPLRFSFEHEHSVPPLEVPDPAAAAPPAVMLRYGAVALFASRARAVRPEFQLTAINAAAVVGICKRLDGLPLAIELAAARVKLLPPEQILIRLDRALALLTGGARDLPSRHQTLRAAIGWSYDLLTESERHLFRRLAVFAGGCTVEAAEAVCSPGGDPAGDVLNGLSALLDNHLLVLRDGVQGESRLAMLETIHEFARDALAESGETEVIHRLHARYFLELAERAVPELVGASQVNWMERLEKEHDNMRGALRWAAERHEAETMLGLVGALRWFWFTGGHLSEGRQWLREALALDAPSLPLARANALYSAAALAWRQADLDAARSLTEQSLALFREHGETVRIARALNLLGNIANQKGDIERAEALYSESLQLQRKVDDRTGIAVALCNLGTIAWHRGDLTRAAELFDESVTMAKEVGDTVLLGELLGNLGGVVRLQGDLHRARALFVEGLRTHQEVGYRYGAAWQLGNLAMVAGAEGRPLRAARLFGAAEALLALLGTQLERTEREMHDRCLADARAQVDEPAWKSAWDDGQTMALERAITYAIEE